MKRAVLVILAMAPILVAGCEPATDPIRYEEFLKEEGEGVFGEWVQSGFYARPYFLHTPPQMDPNESYPLLIVLHGAGGTGRVFHQALRADDATDRAGFITVFPDGIENTWAMGCDDCNMATNLQADDVRFMETLTRHLAENLPVDTTRIYLAGFSQGGQMVHRIACEGNLPIKGIAAVAGSILRDVARTCEPKEKFPVVIVHGTADPVLYFGGYGPNAPIVSAPETVLNWVDAFGCNPEPTLTELPDVVDDFTHVTQHTFNGCAPGSGVVLFEVHLGGHTWPGNTGPWAVQFTGRHSRNLDATAAILEYFESVNGGF